MALAVRAFVSVVMLAGFYVVALVQLAVGFALAFWLASVDLGYAGRQLGLVLFVGTVLVIGAGTWKAIRARPEERLGLALDRAAAPRLWATVDELSAVVGTRGPDEILVIPEVAAAVEEHIRLMGLVGGRRRMYVGMPLLLGFTVGELRSVLAHELGHYSGHHTRLASISYRGRLALLHTLDQIGLANAAGLAFIAYGHLFLRVESAVSRRQELEADLCSVRVAGRETAAAALRAVTVLEDTFVHYLTRYVEPGVEAGYAPDDLFGGFRRMRPALAAELAGSGGPPPEEPPSTWDSHPPLAARVAAVLAAPEAAGVVDERPAAVLLDNPNRLGRSLHRLLLDRAGLTILPWPDFTAAASTARLQHQMDGALRSIGRSVGAPVPDVGAVLDHVAAGHLDAMAAALFPAETGPAARTRFGEPLAGLLSLAAIRSGAARWQHSWTRPPVLVGADGTPLDLTGDAALAADPSTVDEARTRLAARGIDVTAARHLARRAPVGHAGITGGLVNLRVGKARTDVLVLDNGLLLVPPPRLWPWRALPRMIRWVGSGDDAATIADTPGTRFIPFEEIATASRNGRRSRPRWELTLYGGERVTIRFVTGSNEVEGGRDVLSWAVTGQRARETMAP